MNEENKSSRFENAINNTIFATVNKVIQIIFPFINRSVIIKLLGVEYVGISGLFNSIFGVLSLAELGVGNAMLYALYQPVKDDDNEKINAILALYRKTYIIIGIVVSAVGISLSPFLKHIIKSGTYSSDINLQYIYLMNLLGTVSTYLIYAYKASLLEAYQKSSISSQIRIKYTIGMYISQFAVLLITRNYYVYVTVAPICTIATAFAIGRKADKLYPFNKPSGVLSCSERRSITENVKALFLYRIGGIVNNNVDAIVISYFFGARILGIYNNYYMVISAIATLLLTIDTAVLPSLGNNIVSKARKQVYKEFDTISFGYNWIIGWCTTCFACLLDPFIHLWVGSENSLPVQYSIIFAFYFYAWKFWDIIGIYKDAAGLWKVDRYRPLIAAMINLFLNITLTQFIGLYGIMFSTIFTIFFISFPLSAKYLLNWFEESNHDFILTQVKYFIINAIICLSTYAVCVILASEYGWANFLIRIIICIFVPNVIFIAFYHKNVHLNKVINYAKRVAKRLTPVRKNQ